jgi:mono/diheme cytochrome c family protein
LNAVIENSTRHLTKEDLRVIAVYLRSLGGADYTGASVIAGLAQAGAPLYERHCRARPGPSGRGGLFHGPPLAGSAVVQGEDPSSLVNISLHGSDKPQGLGSPAWEEMPAYAQELDDDAIAALANFLRGSWGNRAAPVTPEAVARQR